MPQAKLHRDNAARQAAYRCRQRQARDEQARAKGLPPLPAVCTMPGEARWSAAIRHAAAFLTQVVEEMEEYYDDRSEEWQDGERGEAHQQRTDDLQEILDALDQVCA